MTNEVVTRFWIPVAGLVPVLALAFILEVRVQARYTHGNPRWLVRFNSVVWLVTGVPLVLVELWAINAMAKNGSDPVLVERSNFFLQLGVFGAMLNPLVSILLAANLDLWNALGRHIREMSATPKRLRMRTRAKKLLRKSQMLNASFLETEEEGRRKVDAIDRSLIEQDLRRRELGELVVSDSHKQAVRSWLAQHEAFADDRRQLLIAFDDLRDMQARIDEAHRGVVKAVDDVLDLRYDTKLSAEERQEELDLIQRQLDKLAVSG